MPRKAVIAPETPEEDILEMDDGEVDDDAQTDVPQNSVPPIGVPQIGVPQIGVPQIGESITVEPQFIGRRLDQYLTEQLAISRARVQLLLEQAGITIDGKTGLKPSMKLKGGETIAILAAPVPPPLRATPEDIPLEFVYEDDDMAVINKPPEWHPCECTAAPPAKALDRQRALAPRHRASPGQKHQRPDARCQE
jgi:hypothetical protein